MNPRLHRRPLAEGGNAAVFVLGASGYVGGELLRWIAVHPRLDLAAAVSGSHAGAEIGASFPNLAGAFAGRRFREAAVLPDLLREASDRGAPVAAFSAAPHTESAPRVAALLEAAEAVGLPVPVVDLSADFRHRDPERYREIYGIPHPEPGLLDTFRCGIPELEPEAAFPDFGGRAPRIAHPGCFATAVALAAAPLFRAGLVGPEVHAAAVTGSTGSGGTPKATTHHPVRHANLFAYKPLAHRHAPEMEALLGPAGGAPAQVRFVPHSGPFARGIHATVFLQPAAPGAEAEAEDCLAAFYRETPLVRVTRTPRVKDLAGGAAAEVGAAAAEGALAAFGTLDNLGKGAATGGLQWLNRILGLPEATGLDLPGALWL